MSEPVTIRVLIGTFDRTYGLYETSAPANYDGMGTLVIAESADDHGKPTRYVLIDEKARAWQEGRNSSGLHFTRPVEGISALYVQEKLVRRVLGEKEN